MDPQQGTLASCKSSQEDPPGMSRELANEIDGDDECIVDPVESVEGSPAPIVIGTMPPAETGTTGSKSPTLSRALEGSSGRHSLPLDQIHELCITKEEDVALDKLCKEAEAEGGSGLGALPVEWVVDVADQSNQWFVGTAYSYNDEVQSVYVMVPDRYSPVWQGSVPLISWKLRLMECCDTSSSALFKQVVRESAMEVNWRVRCSKESKAVPDAKEVAEDGLPRLLVPARIVIFLPMGSCAIVEEEKHGQDGGKGGAPWLVKLDAYLELVECESEGPAEDAFYGLVEEGTVGYNLESVGWQEHRGLWEQGQQDEDCEQRSGHGSTILPLPEIFEWGEVDDIEDDDCKHGRRVLREEMGDMSPVQVLQGLGAEMRDTMRLALDLRDRLLKDHLCILKHLRRFIMDGVLEDGQRLLEAADVSSVKRLEAQCASDKDRVLFETSALEGIIDHMVLRLDSAIEEPAQAGEDSVAGGEDKVTARSGQDPRQLSLEALTKENKILEREVQSAALYSRKMSSRVMELQCENARLLSTAAGSPISSAASTPTGNTGCTPHMSFSRHSTDSVSMTDSPLGRGTAGGWSRRSSGGTQRNVYSAGFCSSDGDGHSWLKHREGNPTVSPGKSPPMMEREASLGTFEPMRQKQHKHRRRIKGGNGTGVWEGEQDQPERVKRVESEGVEGDEVDTMPQASIKDKEREGERVRRDM
ncbi:unnamed protein product [Choristocarpus tenellus]